MGSFVLTPSVGVQRRAAFIPTLGSEGPQWHPVKLVCISVSLSLLLFGCTHFLKEIIHTARKCVQRMQPQTTGSAV